MKEKTIIAEWLKYMNAYRIYDVKQPQQTIAYDDDLDLKNTKEFAKHNGYTRIIILPNPKAGAQYSPQKGALHEKRLS